MDYFASVKTFKKKPEKFVIVIPVIKKTHRIAVGSTSAYVKVIQ